MGNELMPSDVHASLCCEPTFTTNTRVNATRAAIQPPSPYARTAVLITRESYFFPARPLPTFLLLASRLASPRIVFACGREDDGHGQSPKQVGKWAKTLGGR